MRIFFLIFVSFNKLYAIQSIFHRSLSSTWAMISPLISGHSVSLFFVGWHGHVQTSIKVSIFEEFFEEFFLLLMLLLSYVDGDILVNKDKK